MILDIFVPLFFFLNDVNTHIKNYKTNKYYVPLEHFLKKEDLEKIEKKLQIQSILAEMNSLLLLDNYQDFSKKLDILKTYPEAESYYLYYLAVFETKQKNYIKSRMYLEQSISLNPDFDPAWNLLGYIQSINFDYENALKSFQKAVLLNRFHPVYCFNLAKTYYLVNETSKALNEIQRCIKMRDNYGEFFYLKGLILEKSSPEQALESYYEALNRNFQHEEFLVSYFELSLKHQNTKSIAKLIDVTKNSRLPIMIVLRFQAFIRFGEIENASKEFFNMFLNHFKTEKEFQEIQTKITEDVKKFYCANTKEFLLFVNQNQKHLQKYKLDFLQEAQNATCPQIIPITPKDPIVQPAL
ncbi:MAG: hypothetical protein NZ853_00375 [Leptospiraceae bacterium]|nr:hypothetical protein [Leptospiraceae bacterium]MDW7976317.1 hypothetical protein [Leptospiraceae bacterium]